MSGVTTQVERLWRRLAPPLLFCLGLLLAGLAPAQAERRVALVIGNSTYKSVVALSNPKNDAEDVATSLRDLGFEVMIRLDVEKNAIRPVLKDFSRLVTGADTALVYYAGHALQYQGRYFLMPTDAALEDEDALKFDMLPADDIKDVLAKVAGIRIMIFDACRNDPFTDRPASGVAPVGQPQSQTRGLNRVIRPQGSIVAFATAPFDVAEDGKARNSPFTRAFLKWTREPGLEITQMFRRITKDVFEITGGRQTPEITVSLLEEYYLNRTESDRMFWARIRWSNEVGDFRDFLSRFPNSEFVPDARFRLQMLDNARRILDEAKRQAEAKAAAERDRLARERQEQVCAAEATRVGDLFTANDKAGLADLRRQAQCPTTAARVDAALTEFASREAADKARAEAEAARLAREEACRREAAQIDGFGSAGRKGDLQSLQAKTTCDDNRGRIDAALADIARREAEAARIAHEEACRKEATQVQALAQAGKSADLQSLAGKSTCTETKALVDTALAEIGRRELAEKQRRELEAAQKAREAQEKAEAAARAARDEACRKEAAQIDGFGTAGRKVDLQTLQTKTGCDENRGRIEAALAEIARREAEAKEAARQDACRKEAGQIAALGTAGKKADLQALAGRIACEENRGRIEAAQADIARREAEAAERQCVAEQTAFDRLDKTSEQALTGFSSTVHCARVAAQVGAELQRLGSVRAAAEAACVREASEVERLKALGDAGREELGRMVDTVTCARLKPVVLASLEVKPPSLPEVTPPVTIDPATRLRRAQTALKRIGCFDGAIDPKRESQTIDAARRYLGQRGRTPDRDRVEIDEDLVARLEAEPDRRVCPLDCDDDEVEQGGRCVKKRVQEKPRPPREPVAERPKPERPAPRAEPAPKSEPAAKPARPQIMLGL
jgi:hypothetical protein